jgi:hypothetical protein
MDPPMLQNHLPGDRWWLSHDARDAREKSDEDDETYTINDSPLGHEDSTNK